MSTEAIQLAALIIQTCTLVIISLNLTSVWRSMRISNRILTGNIFRDRFTMYSWAYGSVSDNDIKDLQDYPENYMSLERYESFYKDNPDLIRSYIQMTRLYVYFAFSYSFKRLELPDPFGDVWLERWLSSAIRNPRFREVHESLGAYYTDFGAYVDTLLKR